MSLAEPVSQSIPTVGIFGKICRWVVFHDISYWWRGAEGLTEKRGEAESVNRCGGDSGEIIAVGAITRYIFFGGCQSGSVAAAAILGIKYSGGSYYSIYLFVGYCAWRDVCGEGFCGGFPVSGGLLLACGVFACLLVWLGWGLE